MFTQRAQPEWKTYHWKTDDGTIVEGVLIYPPHRMGEKNLRMLTLIHGGPADADGDRFEADWYDWANLAAANGWLVFRPNYRGSSGYGDDFMLQIAPHLVSRPGKDILEGVDALVKDGIADPEHLTIGGYSYGGYMTNWLITQTTEFKAAVTGAGAVEHAANWGNDDTTYDDAWYLGGSLPWQNPGHLPDEAALFQMNKVKTPTHIVGGDADCASAIWKMCCWSELYNSSRCRIACWFFRAKDIRWRRIRGTDTSRYGKNCSGSKNTPGKRGARAGRPIECKDSYLLLRHINTHLSRIVQILIKKS